GGLSFVYPEQMVPPEGWVIDPGKPDESILVERIASQGDDLRMPPPEHGPAQLMVHSGQPRIGYPSIGSWTTWGLGTENSDLPGYIVLLSGGRLPRVGKALWSSGFLPSVYQGVQ